MSNALGTLFSDIANAIRGKNGETGTMKPAEFPGKISAIETGGGVEAADGVLFATGLFTPTETPATVTHGLGLIPDMVAVFCTESMSSDTELISTIGFSEAWVSAGYRGSILTGKLSTQSVFGAVTETPEVGFGQVSSATDTTFRVGNPGGYVGELNIGKQYRWIAISGDTGKAWKTVQLSDYLTAETATSQTYTVERTESTVNKAVQFIDGATWTGSANEELNESHAVFDIGGIVDGKTTVDVSGSFQYVSCGTGSGDTDSASMYLNWFDADGGFLTYTFAGNTGKFSTDGGTRTMSKTGVSIPAGAHYIGICIAPKGYASNITFTDVTASFTLKIS